MHRTGIRLSVMDKRITPTFYKITACAVITSESAGELHKYKTKTMKNNMENKHIIIQLLKNNSVHITEARVNITTLICNAGKWMSLCQITQSLHGAYNRATVYRVLWLLHQRGFIEKKVDIENTSWYFFRHVQAESNNRQAVVDEHTYFKCIGCGGITVLEDHKGVIPVPDGFVKVGCNLIISGYCSACAKTIN